MFLPSNGILSSSSQLSSSPSQLTSSTLSGKQADLPDNNEHPLNGQMTELEVGAGIKQYSIQVVPTSYNPLRYHYHHHHHHHHYHHHHYRGEKSYVNQYSVTERTVMAEQMRLGVAIGIIIIIIIIITITIIIITTIIN